MSVSFSSAALLGNGLATTHFGTVVSFYDSSFLFKFLILKLNVELAKIGNKESVFTDS